MTQSKHASMAIEIDFALMRGKLKYERWKRLDLKYYKIFM